MIDNATRDTDNKKIKLVHRKTKNERMINDKLFTFTFNILK